MKQKLLAILLLSITFSQSQTTQIPDINFEQELINLGIDNSDAMGFTDGIVVNSDVNAVSTLVISNSAITDLSGIEAFLALQSLTLIELDHLTVLDVSNNLSLTTAVLDALILAQIDLPLSLVNLTLYNSVISELDLSLYSNLLSLTYRNSILNQLVLGASIENLDVYGNTLSYINLQDLPNLKIANLSNNNFEALNFSANTMLEELRAGGNMLKILDLSANPNLIDVRVANNQLEILDISNGSNSNISVFNAIGNPDLSCIEVDDVAASNSYTGWNKDTTASYNLACHYQVYIPDVFFERSLIHFNGAANVIDNYVSYDFVRTITSLNISQTPGNSGTFLTELTGIESFINLETLVINDYLSGSFTPFDLSQNNLLTGLYINNNINLSSFPFTGLPVHLEVFQATQNPLISIDFSGFPLPYFEEFDASNSISLNAITVPQSTKSISCFNCNLNALNTSNLEFLETLSIGSNNLSSLDTSNNLFLQELKAGDNQLTSLDMSQNTSLIDLRVANNVLTSLNAKNGNNVNMSIMNATGNANLSCIDVDNEMDANDNIGNYMNWQKPTLTVYSENCASLSVETIELADSFSIFPNPTKTHFSIHSKTDIERVEIYSIQGKIIKVFTQKLEFYDVTHLNDGLYIIKLFNGNKTLTAKLIKTS